MAGHYPSCNENHPTYNLFYSAKNIALILRGVRQQIDGGSEIGANGLQPYMRRTIDRYPGLYQPQSFRSQQEFVDQVIRHVQMMNDFVIKSVVQDTRSAKPFFDHYYKLITGNRPLVDRPAHSKEIEESRKSSTILTPNYYQWFQFSK